MARLCRGPHRATGLATRGSAHLLGRVAGSFVTSGGATGAMAWPSVASGGGGIVPAGVLLRSVVGGSGTATTSAGAVSPYGWACAACRWWSPAMTTRSTARPRSGPWPGGAASLAHAPDHRGGTVAGALWLPVAAPGAQYGVGDFIYSWWGTNSYEDATIRDNLTTSPAIGSTKSR